MAHFYTQMVQTQGLHRNQDGKSLKQDHFNTIATLLSYQFSVDPCSSRCWYTIRQVD